MQSKASASGGGLVLGFADEPHRGLALLVSGDALRLCREAGLDPETLIGKSITVRGFIDGTQRPVLAVTYPEQIEILKTKKKAAKQASPP